ncbi:MAG: gliding motility-associated-like protein [Maribacter sp.]|jgi:gliding motility-associated-like protein
MQKTCYILVMLLAVGTSAQTALYNSGNLRIHEQGQLGFHTNLINEAPFDTNLGLAGFYSTESLAVSGTFVPLFYDVEIMVENGLDLALGVDAVNGTNFILGDIKTPRNQDAIFFTFLDNPSFYLGEGDGNKIDGYAAITNKQHFIFPIGDDTYLRPLSLSSESTNLFAKCAYFFEDPNTPVSISGNFDTNNKARDVELVSTSEFWRLESTVVSTVNVSWNARSSMERLTEDSTTIVLLGWSKLGNRWENLGATSVLGNLEQGFITSNSFLPSDYEMITLGSSKIPFEPLEREVVSLENYFVSPNGDGINDTFIVPELADSPNNIVAIYDRYGIKVFEKSNYTNDFSGTANTGDAIINRNQGLPPGIYFYTIFMIDLNLDYQGFLYLTDK